MSNAKTSKIEILFNHRFRRHIHCWSVCIHMHILHSTDQNLETFFHQEFKRIDNFLHFCMSALSCFPNTKGYLKKIVQIR